MTARPDLAALLVDPACAVEVPADAIASVLKQVSAQEAALGTVKAILAARLAVPPAAANGRDAQDLLTDVAEVARIIRRSASWVRKRGHTLPGFCQPGGKGTRVAWSRPALERWIAGDFR